jgi:phosphoglycerate kinase
MAFDIGPDSTKKFIEVLNGCQTLVWNGPVGMFEKEEYGNGTKDIFEKACSKKGFTTIVCGGDTGSAAKKFNAESYISHISTGGGASLEVLEGKILPGLSSLSDDKL